MQLKRLLVNPHFAWPLVARSARQSRITVNTGFLLLFTHIYFVTAGAFSDTGMRMNLFFMLCLTLHTVSVIIIIFCIFLVFGDYGDIALLGLENSF